MFSSLRDLFSCSGKSLYFLDLFSRAYSNTIYHTHGIVNVVVMNQIVDVRFKQESVVYMNT